MMQLNICFLSTLTLDGLKNHQIRWYTIFSLCRSNDSHDKNFKILKEAGHLKVVKITVHMLLYVMGKIC